MSTIEPQDAHRDDIWLPFTTSIPNGASLLELTVPQAPSPSALARAATRMTLTTVACAPGWAEGITTTPFAAAAGEFVFSEREAGDILARLHPLLSPGAELQFILHHPESLPLAHAIATGVEADYLFGRNHALSAVSNLLSLPADASADRVEAAGRTLHRAIAELKQAVQSGQSQGHGTFLQAALDAVGALLAGYRQQPGPAMAAEAREAERQLRGYAAQMHTAVSSAADAAAMERVAGVARDLGYTRVEFEPAMLEGEIFGWQLLMHRP